MEHFPAWLSNSLIYLSAAVIAVPLCQAVGLGSIIAYLTAGIVIGPWGLGLVSDVQSILHFSEFGVVLMLFLVGLELEPQRLWQLRRSIFGLGSAQVLLCAAVLFGGAYAWGMNWQVALVMAIGLALSSTAISLQVLTERYAMGTVSGKSAFSILLFQDLAALPVLALLPLLAPVVVSHEPKSLEGLRIVAVIVGIVLGGRLLLRPLLRQIARTKAREIFTAASLLLVVAIAALMEWVGLSMALGAFLAGVLLAESEYRRELETDIEPFKGLLLGLFFMAVGMSIDFGVIWNAFGTVLAWVFGFLTLKALVIYALARKINLPYQERPVFTLLLAQGGEFAFVVFQAAAGAKVFSAEMASLLNGTVALSMLLSPFVLIAIDKWLLPRFAHCGRTVVPEEISEPQNAPIILAGFGRYGQIIGRMLLAQGVHATVLEHDAEMIEAARTFGYHVFYGDATRLDLLRTAGAANAKIIVVAVDDPVMALEIVDVVQAHFPHLQIVARARDVTHWRDFRDRGVTHVQREFFESSLISARTVLELLGHSSEQAQQSVARFRTHNIALFEQLYPHRQNREKFIAMSKQGRQDLEAQMAQERESARDA